MKYRILFLLCLFSFPLIAQNLQFHYDFRHSLDPERNGKNFPTLYFEYFKSQDSGSYFIQPGSFLLKMQGDFVGENGNLGKYYMQVGQTFRLWEPKIYLQVQYSGGLGISEPGAYGYYITNAFSLGVAYPFQWKETWLTASICYTYNAFRSPSHDMLCSLYWWKGLWNYEMEFAGDFQMWTNNRNHGDSDATGPNGKIVVFFGEPQVWFNLNNTFSVGSKINLYYHVLTNDDSFQIYPTVAIRCKL